MQFTNRGAEIFVPDGTESAAAIRRTTHLAVGAHQDDIPIMAHHGILSCFGDDDRWYFAVTVTDGTWTTAADRRSLCPAANPGASISARVRCWLSDDSAEKRILTSLGMAKTS